MIKKKMLSNITTKNLLKEKELEDKFVDSNAI